jgi:hypothetical protein
VKRGALLAITGLLVGCASAPAPNAGTVPRTAAASITRFDIFVRNGRYDVAELALTRQGGRSTVTLARPEYEGRPRVLLDSVGPSEADAEKVVAMLDSFDIWAMNAPNAPGAACQTVAGQRNCIITFGDYSIVMLVRRGNRERVQRYTGLDTRSANRRARALGDFILAWAREREGPTQ